MKTFVKVLLLVAVVIAAIVADWSLISDCLELSDTCLLWIHGRVVGWIQLVLFCCIVDAFIATPAWMVWDDIDECY